MGANRRSAATLGRRLFWGRRTSRLCDSCVLGPCLGGEERQRVPNTLTFTTYETGQLAVEAIVHYVIRGDSLRRSMLGSLPASGFPVAGPLYSFSSRIDADRRSNRRLLVLIRPLEIKSR